MSHTPQYAELDKVATQLALSCIELLAVIDQFMPHVAKIPLQNYRQLNEAPIAARKAIDELHQLKQQDQDSEEHF